MILRTTEQILFDTIVGKTIKSVTYDGFDATIEFTDGEKMRISTYYENIEIKFNDDSTTPEFIRETEWRKENGHPFSQSIIDKYGKK